MRFFRRDCRTFLIRERKKERFLFSLYITLYISYGSMYPRTKKISRPPELHEHLHFTFVTIRLPYLTFTRKMTCSFSCSTTTTITPSPFPFNPRKTYRHSRTSYPNQNFAFCVQGKKNVSAPPRHLEFLKILEQSGMGMTEISSFSLLFCCLVWVGTCRYSFFKEGNLEL